MEQLKKLQTRFLLQSAPKPVVETVGLSFKPAAVLVILTETQRGIELVLTQRPLHLNAHPGQVAFPGGKPEPIDDNLISTALREAWEEIALPAQQVTVLGTLPQHYTLTGFAITPVVALLNSPFTAQLDANEVSDYFHVPLAVLSDTQNHYRLQFTREAHRFSLLFIPYQQRLIWGATAAIIDNLCQQLAIN